MITLIVFVILCVLVITNRIGGKTYVAKVLYAFDVFCCALITRENGLSISGQCGLYWRKDPPLFWYVLHEILNTLQKDHCELALAHDQTRAADVIKRTS